MASRFLHSTTPIVDGSRRAVGSLSKNPTAHCTRCDNHGCMIDWNVVNYHRPAVASNFNLSSPSRQIVQIGGVLCGSNGIPRHLHLTRPYPEPSARPVIERAYRPSCGRHLPASPRPGTPVRIDPRDIPLAFLAFPSERDGSGNRQARRLPRLTLSWRTWRFVAPSRTASTRSFRDPGRQCSKDCRRLRNVR